MILHRYKKCIFYTSHLSCPESYPKKNTAATVNRCSPKTRRHLLFSEKNIVAAGLADKCEVELAYAIGVAKPVSVMVDTFGTGKVADDKLAEAVDKVFDLKPAAIIKDLELRKPQYRQLAAYGHMGREDLGVAWERTDRTEALKEAVK